MLFSIVIPSFNYAHFLPRALDSVLQQEGNDYEVTVVDDGSTDNTQEVVSAYTRAHPQRVQYLHQPNRGASAARNHGAAAALGQYLLFLDADDALLPDALHHFRACLKQTPGIEFVFGGHIALEANGQSKYHPAVILSSDPGNNFSRFIRRRFGIATGAALLARHVARRHPFPESLRHNEDLVLFAQILARCRCASIAHPVITVHKHPGSLRHNLESRESQDILGVVDLLFDPRVLPSQLMEMRSEFLSRRYLSRFRALYQAGCFEQAKKYYHLALHIYPAHVLQLAYLKKYLRLLLRV